jgi:thiol-disulfide isomerase/thioredoxin
MLNQKCFCLPLWVWLVAIGIAVYYYCYARPENKPKPKPVEEKKEKFANVANTKLKIFNFNTDWCGWSKRFQPEWDKFTQAVKADSKLNNKVEVFDVKCDNPANQQMCEEYNVPGYPYVIVEKNGNRSPYNGERTAQALISFVSLEK